MFLCDAKEPNKLGKGVARPSPGTAKVVPVTGVAQVNVITFFYPSEFLEKILKRK